MLGIITRPTVEINQKSPPLFQTRLLSCLALRRSSIAIILFHSLKSYIFVLCVPQDLREIVFVLQSQSNSFHVRQAERRRADLLRQAHGLTEVRVDTDCTQRLCCIFEEMCADNCHHQSLNLHLNMSCCKLCVLPHGASTDF